MLEKDAEGCPSDADEKDREAGFKDEGPRPSEQSMEPSTAGATPRADAGSHGPRNPFAIKAQKSPEKRNRSLVESLGSLVGSPSPKRSVGRIGCDVSFTLTYS
jgi:hypothetical protein